MPVLVDVVVFDGVDELDVVGPLEVLRRAAAIGADVQARLCSRTGGLMGERLVRECASSPTPSSSPAMPSRESSRRRLGGPVRRRGWAEVRRGQLVALLSEAAGSAR